MQGGEVSARAEWSDEERAAIADEMERILADPTFERSKRCQALLRRLVERALGGDHDSIKERTLGVEVFGREVDYDTAADPIVRITANEIRKRLGQWYQEPDRRHAVRIRLVAGSYLLRFDFDMRERLSDASLPNGHEDATQPPEVAEVSQGTNLQIEASKQAGRSGVLRQWALACAVILVAAIAVFVASRLDIFRSKDYLVWKPLLDSPGELTLCISDSDAPLDADARDDTQWQVIANVIVSRELPKAANSANYRPTTSLVDADVAHKVTSWLAAHGRKTRLRPSSSFSMPDFRQGPVVLIDAFNPWSLIFLSGLRYSVRVDPATHEKWIQDAQNPSKRNWLIRGDTVDMDVDYAVITRYLDTETGQWLISVGGLWPYGTEAACDLLTNPSFTQLIPEQVRSKRNLQIVLKTSVINGNAGGNGAVQILAVYTW